MTRMCYHSSQLLHTLRIVRLLLEVVEALRSISGPELDFVEALRSTLGPELDFVEVLRSISGPELDLTLT